MADVKAITACRTLTLEARDFAELLRVLIVFPLKKSKMHWSHFRVYFQSLGPAHHSGASLLQFFCFSHSILFFPFVFRTTQAAGQISLGCLMKEVQRTWKMWWGSRNKFSHNNRCSSWSLVGGILGSSITLMMKSCKSAPDVWRYGTAAELLHLNVLYLYSRHLTFQELQVQAFSKGDIIIRRGSVGTTLYLMDMGSARVGLK